MWNSAEPQMFLKPQQLFMLGKVLSSYTKKKQG